MPVYVPTTFNAGAAPGIAASELNKLGNGIATCVQLDGSTTMSGALAVAQALSGANKTFLDLNATDGKHYKFIIRTDGAIVLFDQTDSRDVAVWYPAGVSTHLVYDGALATVREVKRFIGTVDPATYTTVNEGDEWDNV